MQESFSTDLKAVIANSRELAILWKHGYIHFDHLFVAMLKRECIASEYLSAFDSNVWEEKIKVAHPGDSDEKGSLPLTIKAERVLKHTYVIAKANNETTVNTVHLLLAILSFDNEISDAASKSGIAMEDITLSYFKKEIKRFPHILKPIRDEAYTKTEIFFSAIGSKKKNLAKLLKNVIDLYNYHQYEDSVKSCEIALALSPADTEFKVWLANNKVRLKDRDAAIKLWEELITEDPEHTGYRLALSYQYDVTGKHDDAAKLLDGLLLEKPEDDTFLNNRGFYLMRRQRYSEAAPFFEKAIKNNPDAAWPQNNLGFTKYKLGKLEDGLALIDSSLELDKGNSYAYRNKGIIFMEQGNKTDARKNFKMALKFGFTEKYDDEVERFLAELDVDNQI